MALKPGNAEPRLSMERKEAKLGLGVPRISPGYKQTEVGVIPEDWSIVSAFDACSKIQDGTHFSPRIGGNDYFYITSKNIRFGHLDISTASRIDRVQHQAIYRRCDVKKGDLLLTKDGANTGNAALNTLDEEFSLLSSVAFLRFHPSQYCPAYFLQQVLTSQGQRQIQDAMAGNAITRLTLEKIKKLRFPVPPTKAEQEAIAKLLSDADALIESLEQLIAKKRQIKQGAMLELLTGKRRLPGFDGEWKNCPLRECLLADPDYGLNAPGVPQTGSLPTYLRITDIDDDGRFIPSGRVAVNHPFSMNYRLGENEIVFARTGASVGKTYLYNADDGEVVFAGFLIRAKIDCSKLCPYFLAAFTKTERYWNWVRVMSMRSGQPGINGNEYADLTLHLPPTIEEQTAIATILSDMDAEIAALEAKLAKARQIKQGMMQELLTGKIRLV